MAWSHRRVSLRLVGFRLRLYPTYNRDPTYNRYPTYGLYPTYPGKTILRPCSQIFSASAATLSKNPSGLPLPPSNASLPLRNPP